MTRMDIEYVAHVLEGGPGVWQDLVRGRRFSCHQDPAADHGAQGHDMPGP